MKNQYGRTDGWVSMSIIERTGTHTYTPGTSLSFVLPLCFFVHFVVRQVVVLGGNGFVGQSVCQAALRHGAEVVSISRSGAPVGKDKKSWAEDVRWVREDIFKPENYAAEVWYSLGPPNKKHLVRTLSKP